MQKKQDAKSVDLLEQFRPLNEADLAIHVKKIEEVRSWLIEAQQPNAEKQMLFLTGPSGSGKSVCVKTIARQLKYDVIEWSTPVDVDLFFDDKFDFDSRDDRKNRRPQKALFDDFLYKSSRYLSLFSTAGASRILLVNDFPNSMLRKPEEFHDSLEKFRSSSTTPIVFVATDASSKALDIAYNLFPPAILEAHRIHVIKFNSVSVSLLKKAIKRIATIIRNDKNLSKLYQGSPSKIVEENIVASSQGDLRNCCLNFLFTCMRGVSTIPISNKTQSLLVTKPKAASNATLPNEANSGLGLCENVSLMHGLGRIFHPKHVKDSVDVRFLHSPESIADCFLTQPTAMLSLLHSNYVGRCSDVQHLSGASENFTLVDVVMNEYRCDQLTLIGLNIAVRAIMVNFEQGAHGWHQIKKKIDLHLLGSDRRYADELNRHGLVARPVPSKVFATEYKGLVSIIQNDAAKRK